MKILLLSITLISSSYLYAQNNTVDKKKDIPTITVRGKEEPDTGNPTILARRPANARSVIKAETIPRFPGCEAKDLSALLRKRCSDELLQEYLLANLKWPTTSSTPVNSNIFASIVVNPDGTIVSPKIAKGIEKSLDAEVMRVLNKMIADKIKWIPANYNGNIVATEFIFPVPVKI